MSKNKSVYLEYLSWIEAEKVMKKTTTAIIPIGARTKEHGHHLPLNNDWVLAEELTKRIAKKTKAIILPTIPYGFYPAFVEYPGSININQKTFEETLNDICRSLARHGIKRCYFLNTGISTLWGLESSRLKLGKEKIFMEYYNPAHSLDKLKDKIMKQSHGTHADEMETSMMLYLAPKIVKMKRAKADLGKKLAPGPLTRNPKSKIGLYSPTGAWGDPTLATRKKGKLIVKEIIRHISLSLKDFEKKNYKAAPPRKEFLRK